MKIIFDYNRTIFNPETLDLYEGVLELLTDLAKEHELYLVSVNEAGREEKMKKFGIDIFFKKALFVNSKTVEVFEEIAFKGEKVFVVGDNINSEIKTGNQMNFSTVLVKQGKFSNLLPIMKDHKPKHTINDIRELKTLIKNNE